MIGLMPRNVLSACSVFQVFGHISQPWVSVTCASQYSCFIALLQVAVPRACSPHPRTGQYYRAGGSVTRSHGNRLLIDEQDRTLVILALAFSAAECHIPQGYSGATRRPT